MKLKEKFRIFSFHQEPHTIYHGIYQDIHSLKHVLNFLPHLCIRLPIMRADYVLKLQAFITFGKPQFSYILTPHSIVENCGRQLQVQIKAGLNFFFTSSYKLQNRIQRNSLSIRAASTRNTSPAS